MLLYWLKMANNPFRFLFRYTNVFVGNMPENNIFERLECRNPVTNYPCKQRNEVELNTILIARELNQLNGLKISLSCLNVQQIHT